MAALRELCDDLLPATVRRVFGLVRGRGRATAPKRSTSTITRAGVRIALSLAFVLLLVAFRAIVVLLRRSR